MEGIIFLEFLSLGKTPHIRACDVGGIHEDKVEEIRGVDPFP